MKALYISIFFCISFLSYSQEDAWVYLVDKQNVSASIANPISILTQKAIDRKNAHNVSIDARDVPVNETYISQLKTQTGITLLAKSKWFNAVHVRGTEADINALTTLTFVDEIKFANTSLNARMASQSSVQDKFEVEGSFTQYNYGNTANQIEMFNGDDLHLSNFTGQNMTVAVIDAGFPGVDTAQGFDRVRNLGHILGQYDFVNRDNDVFTNTSSTHGTLVFSDMAGYIQDQFVGTAPDAQYYLFITENAPNENPVEESYWVEAVERADSLGVDLVNTSLGYKTYDNPNYTYSDSELDGNTAFITKGANIAFEKGLLLVTSAGNSGSNGISAPADAAGVLSIGAVKADGTYAAFSSQGSAFQPTQKPDVVAQGQASYVIRPDNSIGTSNGTSFSSPILAGGIVCLWQALPSLNNAQIMQLVRESASQYNSPDYFLGYGIPNLSQALIAGQTLSNQNNLNINTEISVFPNPTVNRVTIQLPKDYDLAALQLYTILGEKVLDTKLTNRTQNISVSAFSKGIYLLKITTESDEKEVLSKTLKLVIK